MIVVYSTNPPCPKCKVLKKKLDDEGIEYMVVDNTDELKKTGFEYFPVMRIENQLLDFKQAVDWIKEQNE